PYARFPYVAANIVAADGTTLVDRSRIFRLNGINVGVIGIGNPETPSVVAPGRPGDFQLFTPVPAMNAEAGALRARGTEVVIVLAHVGATAVAADGTPRGQIVEMARGARGVDVLIGDHTDMTVNTVISGVLVVENRSKGVEYAVISVDYDRRARVVEGDLQAVFPFNNVAVTFRISGRTLWAALENSVGRGAWVDGRFRNGLGRFLQVSGFRYAFDPRRPPGQRVTTVVRANGTPIAPDEMTYTAVTSDFVYGGGDGFTMLANGTGVTRELIAETVSRAVRSQGRAAVAI